MVARTRVLNFVAASVCEAWALVQLGERQWGSRAQGLKDPADGIAEPWSQHGSEQPWGDPQGLSPGKQSLPTPHLPAAHRGWTR